MNNVRGVADTFTVTGQGFGEHLWNLKPNQLKECLHLCINYLSSSIIALCNMLIIYSLCIMVHLHNRARPHKSFPYYVLSLDFCVIEIPNHRIRRPSIYYHLILYTLPRHRLSLQAGQVLLESGWQRQVLGYCSCGIR